MRLLLTPPARLFLLLAAFGLPAAAARPQPSARLPASGKLQGPRPRLFPRLDAGPASLLPARAQAAPPLSSRAGFALGPVLVPSFHGRAKSGAPLSALSAQAATDGPGNGGAAPASDRQAADADALFDARKRQPSWDDLDSQIVLGYRVDPKTSQLFAPGASVPLSDAQARKLRNAIRAQRARRSLLRLSREAGPGGDAARRQALLRLNQDVLPVRAIGKAARAGPLRERAVLLRRLSGLLRRWLAREPVKESGDGPAGPDAEEALGRLIGSAALKRIEADSEGARQLQEIKDAQGEASRLPAMRALWLGDAAEAMYVSHSQRGLLILNLDYISRGLLEQLSGDEREAASRGLADAAGALQYLTDSPAHLERVAAIIDVHLLHELGHYLQDIRRPLQGAISREELPPLVTLEMEYEVSFREALYIQSRLAGSDPRLDMAHMDDYLRLLSGFEGWKAEIDGRYLSEDNLLNRYASLDELKALHERMRRLLPPLAAMVSREQGEIVELNRRLAVKPELRVAIVERVLGSELAAAISTDEDPQVRRQAVSDWIQADPMAAAEIALGLGSDDVTRTDRFEKAISRRFADRYNIADVMLAQRPSAEMRARLAADPDLRAALLERVLRSKFARATGADDDPQARRQAVSDWIQDDPMAAAEIALGLEGDDASGGHEYENRSADGYEIVGLMRERGALAGMRARLESDPSLRAALLERILRSELARVISPHEDERTRRLAVKKWLQDDPQSAALLALDFERDDASGTDHFEKERLARAGQEQGGAADRKLVGAERGRQALQVEKRAANELIAQIRRRQPALAREGLPRWAELNEKIGRWDQVARAYQGLASLSVSAPEERRAWEQKAFAAMNRALPRLSAVDRPELRERLDMIDALADVLAALGAPWPEELLKAFFRDYPEESRRLRAEAATADAGSRERLLAAARSHDDTVARNRTALGQAAQDNLRTLREPSGIFEFQRALDWGSMQAELLGDQPLAAALLAAAAQRADSEAVAGRWDHAAAIQLVMARWTGSDEERARRRATGRGYLDKALSALETGDGMGGERRKLSIELLGGLYGDMENWPKELWRAMLRDSPAPQAESGRLLLRRLAQEELGRVREQGEVRVYLRALDSGLWKAELLGDQGLDLVAEFRAEATKRAESDARAGRWDHVAAGRFLLSTLAQTDQEAETMGRELRDAINEALRRLESGEGQSHEERIASIELLSRVLGGTEGWPRELWLAAFRDYAQEARRLRDDAQKEANEPAAAELRRRADEIDARLGRQRAALRGHAEANLASLRAGKDPEQAARRLEWGSMQAEVLNDEGLVAAFHELGARPPKRGWWKR